MHAPTQSQLLDLWDAGSRTTPWGRAALLLDCVWPGSDTLQWSLGVVNARLLELRATLFGSAWDCMADCPACGQVAEVRLDIQAMLATAPTVDEIQTSVCHTLDGGEAASSFRLPVLADLVGMGQRDAPSGARLLQAIAAIVDANADDAPAGDITPSARVAIEQQVLQNDPLAAIDIVMDCPSCRHRWRAAADVIGMLWAEMSLVVSRLLGDVARLAAVFGWSEAQILALSPVRRLHYLELVREW
jgi:hypothetical protein